MPGHQSGQESMNFPAALGLRPLRGPKPKASMHTERNRESIIDRFTQLLLAPDVALCRLHRCMAKEKLNLFEFSSQFMAGTGATAK